RAPPVGLLISAMTPRGLVVVLVAALLVTPAQARAASGVSIGFLDGVFTAPAAERAPWLTRAVISGADILRIDIGWDAPQGATRPPGFDGRDPADPNYDFSRADAAIVDATSR